jgi:hypothetical protein
MGGALRCPAYGTTSKLGKADRQLTPLTLLNRTPSLILIKLSHGGVG